MTRCTQGSAEMGQDWENFVVGRDRERALGVWEKASKWGEKQARGCWRLAPPTSQFYHEAALVDALGSEPAEQRRAALAGPVPCRAICGHWLLSWGLSTFIPCPLLSVPSLGLWSSFNFSVY